MATQPDLTIRASSSSYSQIGAFSYIQTKDPGGYSLPVLQSENSDSIRFRLYNNYALSLGVSTALNVFITTFDGATVGSHTTSKLAVSAMWIHVQEQGYGESKGAPGIFTFFLGSDTAVGGTSNKYIPERGSDGTTANQVRAGSDTNGVGFIEFLTYAQVPSDAPANTYQFVVTVDYEWSS